MERKITLQENYALSDVTLGWIGTYLNGKTFLVLFWINVGIKFRKRKDPQFRINWSYIEQQLRVAKSSVTREVKNLTKVGIIKKIEPGVYVWDKPGIQNLINTVQESKEETLPQPTAEKEKIIIIPNAGVLNDLGLMVDDNGNIIY